MQAIVPAAHKLLVVDDNTTTAEPEVEAATPAGIARAEDSGLSKVREAAEAVPAESERWNGKPVFSHPSHRFYSILTSLLGKCALQRRCGSNVVASPQQLAPRRPVADGSESGDSGRISETIETLD